MVKTIDPDTAHACGYNLGKVEERDRIRAQVGKLRDETVEINRKNMTLETYAEIEYETYQKVLKILDGESDGK